MWRAYWGGTDFVSPPNEKPTLPTDSNVNPMEPDRGDVVLDLYWIEEGQEGYLFALFSPAGRLLSFFTIFKEVLDA